MTDDLDSPYGRYHLHVISDDEGLGLIDKVFVRFVGRNQGNQHLVYDEEGQVHGVIQTGLQRSGENQLKAFAQQKVKELVGGCEKLDAGEVQHLREENARLEAARQLALQSLPALQEAAKFTAASGKQQDLYASMSVNNATQKASIEKLLAALKIDPGKDRNYVVSKLADGVPSQKWAFAKDIGAQVELAVTKMQEQKSLLDKQKEENRLALEEMQKQPEPIPQKGLSWGTYALGGVALAVAYGVGVATGYLPLPIMMKPADGTTHIPPYKPPTAPPAYRPSQAITPKLAMQKAPQVYNPAPTGLRTPVGTPPPVYRPQVGTGRNAVATLKLRHQTLYAYQG